MEAALVTVIAILGVLGLVSWVASRLGMPSPVLLALAGIAWASAPALRPPHIDPGAILSLVLPPLLYHDAWFASWLDFRRWLRPILQLAVGLVLFTILGVGLVAKGLMPQLPWAACFLLGAVLSPTDTVATHSVLERLRVPRRATAILGGESLINDATGLLGVQLALVVLLTGAFELSSIAVGFARIAGLGVAVGLSIGGLAVVLNRYLKGNQVLFAFSLFVPYLAYGLGEYFHASGILAVVVAGFIASWRVNVLPPEARVALTTSWRDVVFLLNGLMFLYIGLEAPTALKAAFERVPDIVPISLAVSAAVILTRVLWIFPGAYLPPLLLPGMRAKEGGFPDPRAVTLASWCGVRGAISLAAALSLPAVAADGSPFPGRLGIVACTLVVILITLIGQGLTLPLLVRWLGLKADEATESELRTAREALLRAGITRLDGFCSEEECPIAVYRYRDTMADQLAELESDDAAERERASRRLAISAEVRRAVYEAQSAELLRLRDQESINDVTHLELQLELDRYRA